MFSSQQQGNPQDFELVELLFQEIASTGSDLADQLDKSFEARFHSMVNQTQSYLHSSEKAGFYPHRFLGWFSSILDTKLSGKLGIKKLCFRFEGARVLKVIAETEPKTRVFIFTDDEKANCKFTKSERDDLKEKKCLESGNSSNLQIDVIKILSGANQHLKNKRDLRTDAQAIRADCEGAVCEELEEELNCEELDDDDVFGGVQCLHGTDSRKGLLRILPSRKCTFFSQRVEVEKNKEIEDSQPAVSLEEYPFQKVTKKLGGSVYLESYIEKLASPDEKQVQDNLEEILTYIKEVHTNLNLQDNVYGVKAREANQHGFVAGVFDNFRYRDNTKLYLEQFAGGGYADIVLLVRGPNRAIDSVPILIELKAGSKEQVTPSDALGQAEDYIKGFRPNKMRFLTNADSAIAVGLNLDYAEPFKTKVKPVKQPSSPLMKEFIQLVSKWDNQPAYEEVFKREVKDLLSSEYYTFAANKETKDNYYFSRYMFGASILIDKVDQGKVQSYVYSYGEYPLNWSQGTEHELYNSPVMTLIFVQDNEGQEKTAFIFHIRESNTKEFYADKKVPLLNIPGIGNVGNVIEIKMSLAKYTTGASFEDLFEIKEISKYKPESTDLFKDGEFIEIPDSSGLKEKLDDVTAAQNVVSDDVQDLLAKYRELFTKEISSVIYPVRDLTINKEARLQAILNGLFGSYSDLKLKETATKQEDSAKTVIIPEFQVGAGGRVDMVIQGIGSSPQGVREYIPIALEFKLICKNLSEGQLEQGEVNKLTEEQNIRYAKGAALKTITDGNKMLFAGVIANVRAKDENSLFLISDKFISAEVNHSSEEKNGSCEIPMNLQSCKNVVANGISNTRSGKDSFDASKAFALANCIKQLMGVCEELDPYLEEQKSELPKSVRNLVFASQVCIKNVEYGRYLCSPNSASNFQFDRDRRYVFTWASNPGDNSGKWKVELNGDNVYLKNVAYGGYMYSPNSDPLFQFDSNRWYVFTWTENLKNNKFKWKVELNGDNVYLKNVKYGRYLYSPNSASNLQFDSDRRYVFTWKKGESVSNGLWKIENCGSVSRRMGNTDASSNSGMVRVLWQEQLDHKLLKAVQSCDLGKVKDLVSQGANIDAKDNIGRTPLHYAARNGYLDVVQFITKGGASLDIKDNDNKTASDLAFWRKHDNVVQYLKQVQLDKVDKELLAAAQNNDLNKVRDFITQGANIDTKNKDGSTLLYSAAEIGDLQRMGFLLTNGADTESKNEEYQATPLHGAVANFKLDAVELLLSRGANVNAKDKDHWTPLHYAVDIDHLDIAKVLVDARANLSAIDNYGKTPLDIAKDRQYNNITEYLEGNLNKRGESYVQRKRRHLLNESLSSNNQPEIATSSAIKPSSWINDLFNWVKGSVGGLLNSKPTLSKETSSTSSPISQVDVKMDVNGTIMLLDLLIRKVTGQKYISTVDQSISPLEAQGYVLNITKEFEKVVEQAAKDSKISMHRLNIDFVKIQKEVTGKIMGGKFNEISGILKSYVEKACSGEEAGKLSPKKFEKFIAQFNKGLLNQSIEQILHNRNGTLEVDGAKQMSLEPQSYLSNASVHSHSKVSTCLSEIGVTKLGGNLNR